MTKRNEAGRNGGGRGREAEKRIISSWDIKWNEKDHTHIDKLSMWGLVHFRGIVSAGLVPIGVIPFYFGEVSCNISFPLYCKVSL